MNVVWINQQGTINPFLGAFGFAKNCKSTNSPARNRSIVRILRESFFGSGERDFCRAPSSLGISESGVTRRSTWQAKRHPFPSEPSPFPNSESHLPAGAVEAQKPGRSVHLKGFGVETKAVCDFGRRLIVTTAFGENSGLYGMRLGEIGVQRERAFRSRQAVIACSFRA